MNLKIHEYPCNVNKPNLFLDRHKIMGLESIGSNLVFSNGSEAHFFIYNIDKFIFIIYNSFNTDSN